MTARLLDIECQRCSVGTAAANSPLCVSCNRTIDRILLRAIDGDVVDARLKRLRNGQRQGVAS